MSERRCTRCGSVWSMPVASCVFCGGAGEDRPEPPPVVVTSTYAAQAAAPEGAAEVPPSDVRCPFVREEEKESSFEPIHLSAETMPPLGGAFIPSDAGRLRFAPPIAPYLLGTVAVFACGVLPAAVQGEGSRTLAFVGLLLSAACALLAPVAWYATRRFEARCRSLGRTPPPAARVGKVLGILGTFLTVFEVVAFAILVLTLGGPGKGTPYAGTF